MKKDEYQPRTYRHWIERKNLVSFSVTVQETDLYIRAASDLERKARRIVLKYRAQLEDYIQKEPDFFTSLVPLPIPQSAPRIIMEMLQAGQTANVGPMASVAGAVAQEVGKELLEFSPEIIVENGGDIYLKVNHKITVGIYAGDSPLSGKIGLEIEPQDTPLGVCTSSGTVGHSLSFGKADAVVIVAPSAALADAAATAVCNKVQSPGDINTAIALGQKIPGLKGIVIIMGSSMGVWGGIKLCETSMVE
jgi:uncharacterized protein